MIRNTLFYQKFSHRTSKLQICLKSCKKCFKIKINDFFSQIFPKILKRGLFCTFWNFLAELLKHFSEIFEGGFIFFLNSFTSECKWSSKYLRKIFFQKSSPTLVVNQAWKITSKCSWKIRNKILLSSIFKANVLNFCFYEKILKVFLL